MKRITVAVFCCLVFLLSAGVSFSETRVTAAETASPFGVDYLIGPGDVLDISVWKEEALTKTVVVQPDGKISFPLIGQVQAAGRAVNDLRHEIRLKLIKYAPNEEVTLDIKQINSMIVYIIGRVNQPGRFVLNTNVNVLQALAMAGGLNPFAKRNQIKLFRNASGHSKILSFSYDDVTEKNQLEQNVMLERGDVIVVP